MSVAPHGKRQALIGVMVGAATLAVHGLFLCLAPDTEAAAARPVPATPVAAEEPARPHVVAEAPTQAVRAQQTTAPATAVDQHRSTTAPAETRAPARTQGRRAEPDPRGLSRATAADPEVRELLAEQEAFDRLAHELDTLGRMRGRLGKRKAQRLALETTARHLRIEPRRIPAFRREAKGVLKRFGEAYQARNRAIIEAVQAAQQGGHDWRPEVRRIKAGYTDSLLAAAAPLKRFLGEGRRAQSFLDQLGAWADHLESTGLGAIER